MKTLFDKTYMPDVLTCLANLSNDEVFTPPDVVNKMLDLLPQELFRNPDTTFLDPACKTGVFLREIAKRLIEGLKWQFPDLQERVDHIFHKQLFGIAITELTGLLSRRGVYCSKFPNGEFSVTKFESAEGNIRFRRTEHTWKNGKCVYCGASESEWREKRSDDLETHAYEFIHFSDLEKLFSMKFDVIISNPPYQLSDGGGTGSSAMPIYQLFVEKAMKLQPRYLTMIIPARWYAGGKGLDEFREMMLNNGHIRVLHDFFDSALCFPGVDLSGGVCYFLWDRDHAGKCNVISTRTNYESTQERYLLEDRSDTFIRFNEAVTIIRKIHIFGENSFDTIVSSRRPFGLDSMIQLSETPKKNCVYVYAYPKNGYLEQNYIRSGQAAVDCYKVFIAKAYGERGDFPYLVLGKPFLGEPNTICSETYLMIGETPHKEVAENIISYIKTKFFRFLILQKKNTQNAAKNVYSFVPMQDFSKPWTDEELYAKYNLTDDEISFIESMIRPME